MAAQHDQPRETLPTQHPHPVTHLPHAIAPEQVPAGRRPEAQAHGSQHAHVRLPLVLALADRRIRAGSGSGMPARTMRMPREDAADRDGRCEAQIRLEIGKEVEEGEDA